MRTSAPVGVTVSNTGMGRGGIFVGFLDGHVQWHSPDGTLQRTLVSVSDGEASGLAFDAARNLYVPHWYSKVPGAPGNTVARFNDNLELMGVFGSGYDCNPSSFAFDAAGNVYVGQADCSADILKFDANGNRLANFDAAVGVRGADHIDLATDGCTMFYSNWTKDVLRFDVCTNIQLPKFNLQPLPGDTVWHLRILPDGGVLVSNSQFIVRLDAMGNQIKQYFVLTEGNWWTGLDISPDGTFWSNNLASGNIYKFDLASGAVLASFNAGAPWTAVGVAIKP
jgi:DNA-binding beta-propeller fold protein YncE